MTWIDSAIRVFAVVSVAAIIGSFYGHALWSAFAALAAVIAFWAYQLHAIIKWLQVPEGEVPDTWGVWSDLVSGIRAIHRRSHTGRERAEASVRYLQDSFAAMREGVVMVDSAGAITWLNKAAEPMLGLRYPDDAGQVLTNLLRHPKFTRYFLRGDHDKPLEYLSPADTPCYLRIDVTGFGGGNKLLFIRDISAEKRVEQMRKDFVANVSHELRTPLTVISGYIDTLLALDGDMPQRFRRPMEQMSLQTARMESLLKDLLWLFRIESDTSEQNQEKVNVRALIQEVCEELRNTYPNNEVVMRLDSDRHVVGDYRKLYSALSNLVINAIKYSEERGIVTINWHENAASMVLSVEDNGIGIDPRVIPRLTERFFRVDDSRSTESGGAGLGLAIVKHVAESHDAWLIIESNPGVGSIFTLEFPIEEDSSC